MAVQQGHQVVAELLSEYERRMRKGSQGDDQGEEKKEAEEPQEAAAAGKTVDSIPYHDMIKNSFKYQVRIQGACPPWF